MLAPVGGVSSTTPVSPINPVFNTGTPVANRDAQQIQLERQLETYNRQLAVAQDAARQARQLQQQIATVQQQLEQRRSENQRAEDLQQNNFQQNNAEDAAAAEQLRTDNLLADQQAEELRLDDLAAERLADEQLAADRLAADQLADAQNTTIVEPQIRPPAIEANDLTTPSQTQGTEPPAANEDLIPPLAPDDSGRLINTLV